MSKLARATLSRRKVLAGAVAAAAAGSLSFAPHVNAARKPATFVLVHGAWHGGWCWRRVADRLTARKHYVVAPTLSGVGERSHLTSDAIDLTTHVNDIVNEIKWKDLDGIVLVGHSYAGCVITGVAEEVRERIASIVYVDGFMPENGQSLSDMLGAGAPPWPPQFVQPISAATFAVNAKDRAWVDAKMTPQSVKCFTEKLRLTGASQSIARKLYIRAMGFPSPTFDSVLARCKADATWRTESLPCGHDIMLDLPAELAELLHGSA